MKLKNYMFFILLSILLSCGSRIEDIVQKWYNKEIKIPDSLVFTKGGVDTINNVLKSDNYKILTYINTGDCFECKSRLSAWSDFINSIDSTKCRPECIFIYKTDNIKEALFLIKLANFNYPMCFDQNEIFMRYNDAFDLEPFQSMLLNGDNKIVVIGSPIQNRLIRELMLDSLNVR